MLIYPNRHSRENGNPGPEKNLDSLHQERGRLYFRRNDKLVAGVI